MMRDKSVDDRYAFVNYGSASPIFSSGIPCSNKWNDVNLTCLLPKIYLCDGIDHCDDRKDECDEGCRYSFKCDNGRCLHEVYITILSGVDKDPTWRRSHPSRAIYGITSAFCNINQHTHKLRGELNTLPLRRYM